MMMSNSISNHVRSTTEGDKLWQQERAIIEATERICELMEKQGVSRCELADLIGKSKSRVSQLLDGSANMTLRTLSDLYFSLGRAVHITDGPLAQSDPLAVPAGESVQKLRSKTLRWQTVLNECLEGESFYKLAG
jgi:transcriptional regulator with XRE-family HTH domain